MEDKHKKDRRICKKCYNRYRKKYNKKTLLGIMIKETKIADSANSNNKTFSGNDNNNKKRKFIDYVNIKNIRNLKLEFSNCGKTYQLNHVLLKKQEPIILAKFTCFSACRASGGLHVVSLRVT